jgi:hypothetical protein
MLWLEGRYAIARSEWLLDRLREAGHVFTEIDGQPPALCACPCCGSCTLGNRGDYDICSVCWWEDDGQDNENADINRGGPNRVSLTRARLNFLKEGIAEPIRADLRKLQQPREKYYVGRVFELFADGAGVCELAGLHYCLGASLARLETELAILRLIARFPDLALSDEKIEYKDSGGFRGLKSLMLTL